MRRSYLLAMLSGISIVCSAIARIEIEKRSDGQVQQFRIILDYFGEKLPFTRCSSCWWAIVMTSNGSSLYSLPV